MFKKYLFIALLVAPQLTWASEYFFQTGQAAGKGNASSTIGHWSSAVSFNPALLKNNEQQSVFVLLPSVSARIGLSESVDDLNSRFVTFDQLATKLGQFEKIDLLQGDIDQLNQVVETTEDIIDEIAKLDGLGGNVGGSGNIGVGFKFDTWALSIHASTNVIAGGTVSVSEEDLAFLSRYTQLADVLIYRVRPKYDDLLLLESELLGAETALLELQNSGSATVDDLIAAQQLVANSQLLLDEAEITAEGLKNELVGVQSEYGDIFDTVTQSTKFEVEQLTSNVRFAYINWSELGLTAASKWRLKHGKSIKLGVTAKSVNLDFYDYIAAVNAADLDEVNRDSSKHSESFLTADWGAVLSLDPRGVWQLSATVKNLLGTEILSAPQAQDGEEVIPLSLQIQPQVRLGLGIQTKYMSLAAELDVTEAKGPVLASGPDAGVGYIGSSQFFNMGVEVNFTQFASIRAGYRHNLAASGNDSVLGQSSALFTIGAGIKAKGIYVDLALQASNDSDEVGFALQTMTAF